MKKEESAFVHLTCGALAGVFSDGVVHPIDTVRVRQQMIVNKTHKPTSATSTFFSMLKNEGVTSIYKGFNAVLVGTIPGHALYFYGYEFSKHQLNKYLKINDDNNPLIHFTSGIVADVFGSLTWTPMDVIKQRMQNQIKGTDGLTEQRYKNSFDCCKKIVRNEAGYRGLFKGYWLGLATYGPFVAIYWTLYEQFKILSKTLLNKPTVDELPFYAYTISAGLGSGISAVVTCPLDVIKTRIQINHDHKQYESAFDALKKIQKEEGMKGFFKGVKPRSLWLSGGTAVTMLFCKQNFN
eukprot:gene5501-9318_t